MDNRRFPDYGNKSLEKGRVATLSSSSLLDQVKKSNGRMVKSLSNPHRWRAVLEWGRVLAGVIVLSGLYAWLGGPELLFLAACAAVLALGGAVLYLFGPRAVNLVRSVTPAHTIAGGAVEVTVRVSFRSTIPLPWMMVADRWSGGSHRELLFPGFRRSFSYTYTLPRLPRGFHRLEHSCVSWGDVTGWFTGRTYPQEKFSFRVAPAPLYLERAALEGDYPAGEAAVYRQGRPKEENMDIRGYMPGDPISRIHWKSSARHGQLQTRTPEREQSRMTCIVLDHAAESYEIPPGQLVSRKERGEDAPAFEKAVSAAMGLLLSAEHSGAYVQLFCGGWPEGMARHEGLGKIPGRVLHILTEIRPDSNRTLPQLLEDASRGMIPGMSLSVITGGLAPESAKAVAKLLTQGVKVKLYYVWDRQAPASGTGTVSGSLMSLGAELYCLEHASPVRSRGEGMLHEQPGQPGVR